MNIIENICSAGYSNTQLRRFEINRMLFYVGIFASKVGTSLIPLALIFGLLHSGRSVTDVGSIRAAQVLPLLCLMLLGGLISDRFSRLRILIITDLIMAFSQAGLALCLSAENTPLPVIVIFVIALGLCGAFAEPAFGAIIPQIALGDDLLRVNGKIQTLAALAKVIGPALAGFIISQFGAQWAIGLDAISYLICGCLFSFLRLEGVENIPETRRNSALKEGFREVLRRRWLWILEIQLALINLLAFGPLYILGPTLFAHVDGGAARWGVILSFSGVGGVVGGFLLQRVKPKRMLLMIELLILLLTVHVFALSFTSEIPILICTAFIAGACFVGIDVLFSTAVQNDVPAALLGRVFSIMGLVGTGLTPLAFILAGPAANFLGTDRLLQIGGVVVLLSVITASSTKEIRQTPSR